MNIHFKAKVLISVTNGMATVACQIVYIKKIVSRLDHNVVQKFFGVSKTDKYQFFRKDAHPYAYI